MTLTQGVWIAIGFTGQALFASRFIIQWIASERQKRSVIPHAFWYLSILGSTVLFCYAMHKVDPVFIVGQGLGLLIYSRNIYFIRKQQTSS